MPYQVLSNAGWRFPRSASDLYRCGRRREAFQLPLANITWKAALEAGWNDEQLAEAFATVGATVFTAYFLNYTKTGLDV
jgi:hypothetical protein